MTSILKVDTIQDQSGNNIINENAGTITIGKSGDTVNLASGATAGFGKVLQVVQATTTTEVTSTTATYIDAGLSLSITPSSTSNKIMIFCSYVLREDDSGGNAITSIFRGATDLAINEYGLGRLRSSATANYVRQTITLLDEPSASTEITYTLKLKGFSAGDDQRIHANSSKGSLVLMEVAG